MLSRLILVFLAFLALGGSASAGTISPLNDPALLDSVKEFRQKNYATAIESALKAPETPARSFLLGIYFHRNEKWSEAAESFAKSLQGFDLLADYSLYYRADSLFHLTRYDEAAETLRKLKKEYPASPLIKSASILYAESLYGKNDFAGAANAFQKYVESYPSGPNSVKAVYQAALCREALGDRAKAASEIRDIWLKYPGSPVALQAENDLRRLAAENVPIAPYTAEEIFNRGVILYDLQKYKQAIQTFKSLSAYSLPESFRTRLAMKTGQTLFKSRQYKDAAQALSKLAVDKDPETSCEASYWLARTLDRSSNEPEAALLYNKVAETFPKSELADDALYYAAMIRKFRGENKEAIGILEKLASRYPSSVLAPKALWETAWMRYLDKDFKAAADTLTRLLQNSSYRETALYWLGKSEDALGEKERANAVYARLLEEYPYSYYSLQRQNKEEMKNLSIVMTPAVSIPLPAGYERVKALIAFGLVDEARMELTSSRKKSSGKAKLLEIARLYWEMQDYRNAMGLFRKMDRNCSHEWNFSYPRAFSEHVSHFAADYGVPESLAYSIIRAESNFYPSARSPVGAVGLMQVMPATAKFLLKGESRDSAASQLTRPELNINLGMKHLQYLVKRYRGNLVFAVAAYNSGATPVDRWRRNFSGLRSDEFIENIPYPETREYVKKVLTSMEIYKSLYGLDTSSEKAPADDSAKPSSTAPGLAVSSD